MGRIRRRKGPPEDKRWPLASLFIVLHCLSWPPGGFLFAVSRLGIPIELPSRLATELEDSAWGFLVVGAIIGIVVARLPSRRAYVWGISIYGFFATVGFGGVVGLMVAFNMG